MEGTPWTKVTSAFEPERDDVVYLRELWSQSELTATSMKEFFFFGEAVLMLQFYRGRHASTYTAQSGRFILDLRG